MNEDLNTYHLLFTLEGNFYSLPLDLVERVYKMAALIPVPDTVSWIIGLIDIAGKIHPVVDLREMMGLVLKRIEIDDFLIHTRGLEDDLLLRVDSVISVFKPDPDSFEGLPPIVEDTRYFRSIIRAETGDIAVLDIVKLFADKKEMLSTANLSHR